MPAVRFNLEYRARLVWNDVYKRSLAAASGYHREETFVFHSCSMASTCEKLEYEASRIAAACVRRQWNGDRDGAFAARRQLCGVMQELLAFGYECRNRPSWVTSEVIIQNEQGL